MTMPKVYFNSVASVNYEEDMPDPFVRFLSPCIQPSSDGPLRSMYAGCWVTAGSMQFFNTSNCADQRRFSPALLVELVPNTM